MGQEVKKDINCQSYHGLSGSGVKTGKLLPDVSREQKICTFLGLKVKKMPFVIRHHLSAHQT